jgi:ATP-binding cassette, subfamily C (CFTR/MRP), member 1
LPLADQIIVLADNKIAEKGTWDELRSSSGYISKLQVRESEGRVAPSAATQKPPTIPGTEGPSKEDIMDLTRRTGDLSVYGESIGILSRRAS